MRLKEKSLALLNKNFTELNPIVFGEEGCEPEHAYGPAIRKYFLIHHVLSGKGTFTTTRGTYTVSKDEAFIIVPEEVTLYTADKDDPWHYVWIGFDGTLSKKFAELPDVIQSHSHIFREMRLASELNSTAEEYLAGKIFELYSKLFSRKSSNEDYILKIKNFVDANYNSNCDVAEIATVLNLERHYLSRVFKQKTGATLKAYITEKRMDEAKRLMADGNSVSYSALMSGYKDPFVFSKMFKKMYGISPAEWKKRIKTER